MTDPPAHSPPIILLTKRQTQVAVLVAQGCGYKEIARELGISWFTVRALVVQIALRIPNGSGPPLRRVMRFMLAEEDDPPTPDHRAA